VKELSDGRIFSGEQAKTVRLVDELGGLNDAIDGLAAELQLKGKPRVVYPAKKKRVWDLLSSLGDDDEDSESKTGVRGSLFERALAVILGGQSFGGPAQSLVRQGGPMYILPWAAE
jgi:ClpP class serine protease